MLRHPRDKRSVVEGTPTVQMPLGTCRACGKSRLNALIVALAAEIDGTFASAGRANTMSLDMACGQDLAELA